MDVAANNLSISDKVHHGSPDPVQVVEEFSEANAKSNLELAVNDVKSGKLTAVEASRQYGVNRSTINNHVGGRCQKMNSGKQPKLPGETEQELADYLVDCADLGDPRTKQEFLLTVGGLAKLSHNPDHHFNNDLPTKSWFKGFMKRHPEIRFRKPQEVTPAAAKVQVGDIVKFIQGVRDYLDKRGLLHLLLDANQFGDGDESGFELNPSPKKVLAAKGSKSVYKVQSAKAKESITAFYTVLASGVALEPQLVFKSPLSKLESIARSCGEVGANFALSHTPKGWQTQESFFNYLSTKFIDELDKHGVKRTPDYPFVLFLDGHVSHKSFKLFKWGKENNIIIIILFPNATHILQPLDVGIFGALKAEYAKQIELWKVDQRRTSEPNKNLDEVSFVKILKKTNDAVLNSEIIEKSFRATGLFPLDETAIHFDRVLHLGRSHPDYQKKVVEEIEKSISDSSSRDSENSNPSSSLQDIFQDVSTSAVVCSHPRAGAMQYRSSFQDVSEIVHPPKHDRRSLLETTKDGILKLYEDFRDSGDDRNAQLISAASQIFNLIELSDESSQKNAVLGRPTIPKRDPRHKNYKLPSYGVMTSDEFIGKNQEVIDQQVKESEEKEKKADERKKKKMMIEAIKNIKKEKTEAKRKAEENLPQDTKAPPKKRGRPSRKNV